MSCKNFSLLCKNIQNLLNEFVEKEELYLSEINIEVKAGDGITGNPVIFIMKIDETPEKESCDKCGKQ